MKFKVIFEYDEPSRKWEVFVEGATSELEALQGFNAVLLTAQEAVPMVECNKAIMRSAKDRRYEINIGVLR